MTSDWGPGHHVSTPRQGVAKRFFSCKSNVDFSNDFIVIENEEPGRRPTRNSGQHPVAAPDHRRGYLTRNRRKVLFIDELKQQGDIGADDPVKAAVVEGAAAAHANMAAAGHRDAKRRRLLRQCPDGGGSTAPTGCSAATKPESIEILDLQPGSAWTSPRSACSILLRTEAGAFSELYISSPVGEGVARKHPGPCDTLLFSRTSRGQRPSTPCARRPVHRRGDHRAAAAAGACAMKAMLLHAGLTALLVASVASPPTTSWVVRPALVMGVVDPVEVYPGQRGAVHAVAHGRLGAGSEGERERPLSMARSFSQRLPVALDELPREWLPGGAAPQWLAARTPWTSRRRYAGRWTPP